MKVSVLGCGRWGTFLGWYSCSIGHNILIWGRNNSKNFVNLRQNRKNEYLSLQENIILSDSIEEALKHGDYIIISISSQNLRGLCREISKYDLFNKTIILAMKGIENKTGLRLTQVVNEEIKQKIGLAIWVGPGHAQSYINSIPNCMLISSIDIYVTKNIISHFNSDLIRLYMGQDLIGNEVGAAAKNIMGFEAGILDGLN